MQGLYDKKVKVSITGELYLSVLSFNILHKINGLFIVLR